MKKILLILFGVMFAFSANATTIPEGAVVKTATNPDVYIIKYKNGKQYKRLVLNPQVFESYGHLKWENLLIIAQSEMDSFSESTLVKVDGQNDVYKLAANGDLGDKAIVESNYTYDLDSVYTINSIDFGNYLLKNIEELPGKIDELRKQADDIISEPSTQITPPIETWAEQEARDFAYADARGWTTLISTNSLGEKRYYRKEGSQWIRKNSEAEIQQPYIEPPTLNQLTRLVRMCTSDPEVQAICDNSAFMPGYYSNLVFRTAIDSEVSKWESIVADQLNYALSTTTLPPLQVPSSVFGSSPPVYTPPPTYDIKLPSTSYSTPSSDRIEFLRDPRTNRIYSSSNGTNYFYDLNGRLDHTIGSNGMTQINYDLNGNIDSISY